MCIEDQLNLNQTLQGVLDYENNQLLTIEGHFATIKAQIDREMEKLKDELRNKVQVLKLNKQNLIERVKSRQSNMEEIEYNLGWFTDPANLNIQADFSQLKLELKEVQHQLSDISR